MRNANNIPRLIITRPEPDATAFAESARSVGFDPVIAPVMTVSFSQAGLDLGGVGALAFTSANGVRAFAAAQPDPCALPVFAVGGMTAKAAQDLGFANLGVADGDVASLAAAIAVAAATGRFKGRVLHIAGADRAGDLAGALCKAGVEAKTAVLYRAEAAGSLSDAATAALAAEPPAEAVALFSPRTARVFLELVHRAGLTERLCGVVAACLSEAVAKAAAGAGWRRLIVANERGGESLLSTLLREIEPSRG